MKNLLKSRKLRAALAGVAVALLYPLAQKVGVPIGEDQIEWVVMLLLAYIGGVAIEDMGKGKAALDAAKPPAEK